MLLEAAATRVDIANYVGDLFGVYTALVLIYILANLLLSFGARPPYTRWFDVVMGFLRDVCDPYLAIFRRLIPGFGAIDFSPIIGLFMLGILDTIVVGLIKG